MTDHNDALYAEILVTDYATAVAFYEQVMGAKVTFCYKGESGQVMHSNLKLKNGANIFIVEETFDDEQDSVPVKAHGVTLHLEWEDVDGLWKRMESEGGSKITMPLADQFWGQRYGRFVDPFGYRWSVAEKKQNQTSSEAAIAEASVKADIGIGKIAADERVAHTSLEHSSPAKKQKLEVA